MSELLVACNEENLEFQNLDKCGRSLDYHHKKGTTITFGTEVKPGLDGHLTEKLGLILWLDRDAVTAALAQARGEA
jgi:hypothetical protein